ncbi:sugar phosphate isomerase/epimerase family protein [Candidatus Caldatribacterium sp.]|uniref:sugar phosphate isomerase/epimerase family protein n=1 Tax=Candidatus Caldatribacterium sp. TaxID=2282143 RepID=UPI0029912E4C|nr:sugar phosphate isomerase/epimerase [Candidatus Caldatribacterium sp.]MDW8080576.1 sugar phosphate isomerase/epimerase [Candidatus Calescibacterium sp.]
MFRWLAVTTNTYHGFSLEEALEGIARAGFRYVELSCVVGWTEHFRCDQAKEKDLFALRRNVESFGLSVVSLSAHANLATEEGCAYLSSALLSASLLGARVVNTGTIEQEHDIVPLKRNLERLIREAETYGISIGLETHGEVFPSGSRLRELLDELKCPCLGINYDTGNVIFYGSKRPEEDLPDCLPYVVHMHLKDKRGGYKVWDFPPLGEGTVDFPRIFKLLREAQRDVPLSVEIEFNGLFRHPRSYVDEAVQLSFQYLQRIMAEGDVQ